MQINFLNNHSAIVAYIKKIKITIASFGNFLKNIYFHQILNIWQFC